MSKVVDELVLIEWRKLEPARQEQEFLKAQDEIGALRLQVAELASDNAGLQTAACVATLANEDAQAQLAVYDKIVEGLKALQAAQVRSDWYDLAWPLAFAAIESACNCDLEAGYAAADWIRANPKP